MKWLNEEEPYCLMTCKNYVKLKFGVHEEHLIGIYGHLFTGRLRCFHTLIAATETEWPLKPKILATWLFTWKVC